MAVPRSVANEIALGILRAVDVTIAENDATGLSESVSLFGWNPVGILTAVAWTAADITFAITHERTAGTFLGLYLPAGELTIASASIPIAARRYIALDYRDFALAQQMKVRSGVEAAAVTQLTADRVLTVLLRRMGGS